jgi:hypothetical protein
MWYVIAVGKVVCLRSKLPLVVNLIERGWVRAGRSPKASRPKAPLIRRGLMPTSFSIHFTYAPNNNSENKWRNSQSQTCRGPGQRL